MKINEIIKTKRIALNLTQEQIALSLGVSTPAVNKWEKGGSYPDITLLPPLARLLGTDLNTLMSFNKSLTDLEINNFSEILTTSIATDGFEFIFKTAMDKICEYPTCDKLISSIALILDSLLIIYASDMKDIYEDKIQKLHERCADSDDLDIKNISVSMLIGKFIGKKDFENAQIYIDKLPNIMFNKKFLQGNLYVTSDELEKAKQVYQQQILAANSDVFAALSCLQLIAHKEDNFDDALYFAKIIEDTTTLFDLWDFNTDSTYFTLYSKNKDVDNTLLYLEKMLESFSIVPDYSKSKLYTSFPQEKNCSAQFTDAIKLTIINAIENDEAGELDFIKDNKKFIEIMKKHTD